MRLRAMLRPDPKQHNLPAVVHLDRDNRRPPEHQILSPHPAGRLGIDVRTTRRDRHFLRSKAFRKLEEWRIDVEPVRLCRHPNPEWMRRINLKIENRPGSKMLLAIGRVL